MNAEALQHLARARAAIDDAEAVLLLAPPEVAPEAPKAPIAPPVVAPAVSGGLTNPAAFFDHMRAGSLLGPTLSPEEVSGCETILAAGAGILPLPWVAYCLGTAAHETGGEMAPNIENLNYTTAERIKAVWPSRFPTVASAQPFVRNAKGLANHVYNGRMGNRPGTNDGWDFRGRGQAHLTGREMYAKLDAELGLDGALIANPDLAMRPDISARVLVVGMLKGLFTGKRLNDFIGARPTTKQFVNARVIVNPDSNGALVAKAAEAFMPALTAGGWR